MSFISAVEAYRDSAVQAINQVLTDYPDLASGLTNAVDDVTTIVLGIVQHESGGNPFVLGDPISPATWQVGSFFNQVNSAQLLDQYDSVGLMQLDYGKGNPQADGFTGQKSDLFDPGTNLYYGSLYIIKQLVANGGDTSKALAAYNSGRPIVTKYVEQFVNYVNAFLKKPGVKWWVLAGGLLLGGSIGYMAFRNKD